MHIETSNLETKRNWSVLRDPDTWIMTLRTQGKLNGEK